MKLTIAVFAAILSFATVVANYCKYQKFTSSHTYCKPPNAQCKILAKGVSHEDQRRILLVHNQLRNKVAQGGEKRGLHGGQPKAADMLQLKWDPALAEVAQKHAEQCVFQHDCNDCRKVDGYPNVGQNIRVEMHSRQLSTNWKQAVTSWYNEVKNYDSRQLRYFKVPTGAQIGHYSQIVWAKTSHVGCGFAKYLSKRPGMYVEQLYTCNYGPSGNVLSTMVYQVGEPCSQCPWPSHCSRSFKGLCKSM